MFGISADNTPSQAEFAKQLKLAFPLLSDFARREVIAKYGVLWPDRGYANRATFVVDKEGKIVDLQVISGPKELVQAAMGAVQQWRYKPYLLEGEPVEVDTEVQVNFQLRW